MTCRIAFLHAEHHAPVHVDHDECRLASVIVHLDLIRRFAVKEEEAIVCMWAAHLDNILVLMLLIPLLQKLARQHALVLAGIPQRCCHTEGGSAGEGARRCTAQVHFHNLPHKIGVLKRGLMLRWLSPWVGMPHAITQPWPCCAATSDLVWCGARFIVAEQARKLIVMCRQLRLDLRQ